MCLRGVAASGRINLDLIVAVQRQQAIRFLHDLLVLPAELQVLRMVSRWRFARVRLVEFFERPFVRHDVGEQRVYAATLQRVSEPVAGMHPHET